MSLAPCMQTLDGSKSGVKEAEGFGVGSAVCPGLALYDPAEYSQSWRPANILSHGERRSKEPLIASEAPHRKLA